MRFFSITNVFFLSLLSTSINHATLLWRINVEPPAYLLGTIHIPHPLIWPTMSETAKKAFQESTHFFPEIDMTNFFTATQLRLCTSPPFPLGIDFLFVFNSENFERKFLASMQPVPQPLLAPFLDLYLMMEARRTKKTVSSLESIDIYCEVCLIDLI